MAKLRHLALGLLLIATFLALCASAQTNLTQIRDTIYNANGTPFNGTVTITWTGSATSLGGSISPLSTSARIYNGALSVLVVPTTSSVPGTYYQALYVSNDGTTMWTETWQVPASSTPLSIAAVRISTTGPSGNGSGGSTGVPKYATLPISMSDVTNLNSSLSQINSTITTLTSTSTAQSSTITNLNNTVGGLSSTVTGLNSSFGALNNSVSGMTNTVNSLNSTVGVLGSTVTSQGSTLTALNGTVGSLSSTVTNLAAAVNNLSSGTQVAFIGPRFRQAMSMEQIPPSLFRKRLLPSRASKSIATDWCRRAV